jgi:hypothetical protein
MILMSILKNNNFPEMLQNLEHSGFSILYSLESSNRRRKLLHVIAVRSQLIDLKWLIDHS